MPPPRQLPANHVLYLSINGKLLSELKEAPKQVERPTTRTLSAPLVELPNSRCRTFIDTECNATVGRRERISNQR